MRTSGRSPAADDLLSRMMCVTAGAVALVGGAVSFLGWPLDARRLTDWFDTGVSIQPNAATLLMLAGLGLILVQYGRQGVGLAVGAFVALVGALTLTQYIVGADFGFNDVLLFGREWGQSTTMTRGRVGPPASSSFALIGTSLMILSLSQVRRGRARWALRVVPFFGLLVCTFMLFSLIGYAFGARRFYTVPWLTAIALQAASMLMVLGAALIAAVPQHQPMRLLRERSSTAMLARFALPLLIVLPFVVAWLRGAGQRRELYDEGTGIALAVVAMIVIGVALMWRALMMLGERERQGAETARQLQQSEERLRGIIAQLPAGVGVMDAKGEWTLTNALMEMYIPERIPAQERGRALRWRAWDEQGRPIGPEQWPAQRALRGESTLPGLEMLYTDDDGREIWMRVSAAPLRDDAGRLEGATCVVYDIDLPRRFRVRLQDELTRATSELAAVHEQLRRTESMAMLGSLSAGIAHDLGNLLMPLRGHLRLLQEHDSVDDAGQHIEAIARGVGYIGELASRLRQSMTSAKKPPSGDDTEKTIELSHWCRETEQFFRSVVPDAVTLSVHIPERLPVLQVDRIGLTQAVYNLIQNSVKAMRRSGVGSRVVLRAATGSSTADARGRKDGSAQASVEICVVDDGPGMHREVVERCMEPHFTTDAVGGGMGLGLSLVKAFVESSGGSIEVTSPPTGDERGTAVTLRFPIHAQPPVKRKPSADVSSQAPPVC